MQALVDRQPGQRTLRGTADQRGREIRRQRFAYAEQELVAVVRGRSGRSRLLDTYEQMQQSGT